MKRIMTVIICVLMTLSMVFTVIAAPEASANGDAPNETPGEVPEGIPEGVPTVKDIMMGFGDYELKRKDEKSEKLDTIWIFFDNTLFEQYAVIDDTTVLISRGTYEDGKNDAVSVTYTNSYVDGEGAVEAESEQKELHLKNLQNVGTQTEEKPVHAIFYGEGQQSHKNEKGETTALDSLWIYYSDNTFEQYADLDGKAELYSTGTYTLPKEDGFHKERIAGDDWEITISRTQKYKAGKGLVDYESMHTYKSEDIKYECIYYYPTLPPHVSKASVVSAFAIPEGQSIKNASGKEEKADTLWIYYSDNTFDQYAEIEGEFRLFSKGTYDLSDDFIIDTESEDNGTVVIRREEKFDAEKGLSAYRSVNTVELGTLGYKQIYSPKDEKKQVKAMFANAHTQEYTDKNGIISMVDAIWIYYTDMTFEEFIYLDDGVELYASGTYEFGENSDFHYNEEEDHGTITLQFEKIREPKKGELADSKEKKTYRLNKMGYKTLFVLFEENKDKSSKE